MKRLRHHYEIMQLEFFSGDIIPQNVDQAIGHASVCRSAPPTLVREVMKNVRGLFWMFAAVCLERRVCDGEGLKPKIYNIVGGMSKLVP